MEECVDGEYQDFKSKNGAYIRENFFGRYPETAAMVADWSDDKIWALTRGGHDPLKVYAAYKAAVDHKGQPTRDPRQDRQGLWHGRGRRGADDRASGQEDGRRGAQAIPRPLQHSGRRRARSQNCRSASSREDSEEMKYLRAARAELGGYLPARRRQSEPLAIPPLSAFDAQLKATRRPRDLHHHGFRARAQTRCCATRISASASCRSCRTKAAPSAWRACSVNRHLLAGRPALPAAGRRPAVVL